MKDRAIRPLSVGFLIVGADWSGISYSYKPPFISSPLYFLLTLLIDDLDDVRDSMNIGRAGILHIYLCI